jgi:hypothetical protein
VRIPTLQGYGFDGYGYGVVKPDPYRGTRAEPYSKVPPKLSLHSSRSYWPVILHIITSSLPFFTLPNPSFRASPQNLTIPPPQT